MAPQFVKPYLKANKSDRNDAEAICEAVGRPNVRFVPVKTAPMQAVLALRRARQGFVKVLDSGFNGNTRFVMQWTDFDRLCRFWFDCLFRLDRQVGNKPVGYQRRVLAFLSERLFDIHVRWLRDSGRRVVVYSLFFMEDSVFSNSE